MQVTYDDVRRALALEIRMGRACTARDGDEIEKVYREVVEMKARLAARGKAEAGNPEGRRPTAGAQGGKNRASENGQNAGASPSPGSREE